MFSPFYAWSRRDDPENHCALNLCLYGEGAGALGGRWSLTERRRDQVEREAAAYRVGPSTVSWDGTALTVEAKETAVPQLTPLRGRIRVIPEAVTEVEAVLDAAGRQIWRPFAPKARIEVAFDDPSWSWSGEGYIDANFGAAMLEEDFSYWTWSRAPTRDGAVSFYDAARRDGSHLELAMRFHRDGRAERIAPPPKARLSRGLWGVRRETRADAGSSPRTAMRLENAPFYTRSALATRIHGEDVLGMHEALDLDRFASPAIKTMLPFRMPRPPYWPPGWLKT
ncbi:MAG: carotenoid 1,2-hydratase [Pseudomonadota bacterium]